MRVQGTELLEKIYKKICSIEEQRELSFQQNQNTNGDDQKKIVTAQTLPQEGPKEK